MRPDVQEVFDALDQHLRMAAIARTEAPGVGSSLWASPFGSGFGGRGVGRAGEQLPQYEGRSMFPLLQINTAELPTVPAALQGIQLLALFMNRDSVPFDRPAGQGWLIREYASLEGLAPLPEPDGPAPLAAYPVKWELAEAEAPSWEDTWSLVDLKPVTRDGLARRVLFMKYQNHPGTKVGGYPTAVRRGVGLEDYVFQVGNEELAGWRWGENGMAYFFRAPDGEWRFTYQSD